MASIMSYSLLEGGFTLRCLREPSIFTTPTVTTSMVTNITQTIADGGGTVTSDGGATVTARGVCWSVTSNPTIAGSHTTDGTGTGMFTSSLSGLTANTLYYVRAYATNGVGLAYGNEVIFRTISDAPCPGLPTISYEGKTYNTVQIGTQCWLAHNLNVGTKINGAGGQANNATMEKYCYNDLESNCDVYGGLYQWGEMVQYLNGASNTTSWNPTPTGPIPGICPSGWHLPTDVEWCTLTQFIDPTVVCSAVGMIGTDVGAKMKEPGTLHWASPNTGATNSSGFTVVPGGYRRSTNGSFSNLTIGADFWPASESSATQGWDRYFYYNNAAASRTLNAKADGYSVRCVKDNCTTPGAPTSGTHVPSSTQIVWNWNTVAGATGYKWSTTNNYAGATDMGTATTNTETGLACNTAYTRYAWAYNDCGNSTAVALNQTTTACAGAPCAGTPTVSYGGQTYNTVQIGTQCWLRENLNIGTMINGTMDQTNNGVIEKYCYNDDNSNCDIYGGLYQWDEVMQYVTTAGVQGICPSGWHIPTDAQWTSVTTFLGGEIVAGGKMKTTGTIEAGTGLWYDPNYGATNESGFSAVPAGYRYYLGTFDGVGYFGYWWSSTEFSTYSARCWFMGCYNGNVNSYPYFKSEGYSVRCLRDF